MSLSRNRFNLYLSLACLAGYVWLAIVSHLKQEEVGVKYDVCLIRYFAGIPCPSCGSTRSVLALMHGDLAGGIYWNPLGILIFAVLMIFPFWMGYDLLFQKDSLFKFYRLFETTLRRRWVAISAIALILINWGWNIMKGL